MTTHSLIHNREDIYTFASLFHIEKKHLALCLNLTMRKKYYPIPSSGTNIINRIIITGGKDFENKLYQAILKLEPPVGSYIDGDVIVPNEALALYALLEPKDTIKALSRTMAKCVEAMTDLEEMPNAYSLYRTEIGKCSIKNKKYRQIDLDTKDIDKINIVNSMLKRLNVFIIICIETRGGFHIVYTARHDDIYLGKDINRELYAFKQTTAFEKENIEGHMVKDYWFSITSDPNIIVPGVYQGGFPARIINLDDWLLLQ